MPKKSKSKPGPGRAKAWLLNWLADTEDTVIQVALDSPSDAATQVLRGGAELRAALDATEDPAALRLAMKAALFVSAVEQFSHLPTVQAWQQKQTGIERRKQGKRKALDQRVEKYRQALREGKSHADAAKKAGAAPRSALRYLD